MIRYYTFILCSLFLFTATAQNWCPPGATWTYEAGMFLGGYNRMSYAGDTVIEGYTAQIIDRTSAIQYPQPPPEGGWSDPFFSYDPVAVITRLETDVVYLLYQNEWDTLYYFNAEPGDGWTAPHITDTTCMPFVVADTGTVLIDGLAIRWLEIEGWYRIYERIGSTWDMMMFCPNWIIDGPTGMRCYSDDQIDTTFSNYVIPNGCDWLMEIEDPDRGRLILLHPNPGTDHFTLQLPPGDHELHLFDQLGRSVMETTVNSDRTVIGTASLPPGIYTVLISEGNGPTMHQRWVKQ